MMSSYIIGAESQGHDILNEKIPTIFEIQEYIETAWDNGIFAQGRIETGGIRGTRKYIGTPDVSFKTQNHFLLTYSDIPYVGASNVLQSRHSVSSFLPFLSSPCPSS